MMKMRSMTGYGRGQVTTESLTYVVEVRTVNHRYLEIQLRLPSGWMALEEEIKKRIQRFVHRGRVELFLRLEGGQQGKKEIRVDWELLSSLQKHRQQIEQQMSLTTPIQDLWVWKEILQVEESPLQLDDHRPHVLAVVDQACQQLQAMRQAEGAHLAQDLKERSKHLHLCRLKMEQLAKETVHLHKERLQTRLQELLIDHERPEERLLTEIAILAERSDVTEELTRLESHLQQFEQVCQQEGPVGRRLDFLLQEMNREVNTIGSKAQHPQMSSWVVEAKSELEKMREQVQNIE
jgi:uncharacterized protein (TIGR00255 family)